MILNQEFQTYLYTMKKFIFALFPFLVYSCAGIKAPQHSMSKGIHPQASLENTHWILADGISSKGQIPSLLISSNGIAGNAGCNEYFTKNFNLIPSRGGIQISQIGSTRKACPNMSGEKHYLEMLKQVDRYVIQGDHLELYQGDLLLLRFKRNK